jgi:hypothetical protein
VTVATDWTVATQAVDFVEDLEETAAETAAEKTA